MWRTALPTLTQFEVSCCSVFRRNSMLPMHERAGAKQDCWSESQLASTTAPESTSAEISRAENPLAESMSLV